MISQSEVAGYLFVVILGLIILRRSWRLTHGAPVTTGRLVAIPVLYVLLYGITLATIGVTAVGTSLATLTFASFAADAALVAVGFVVAYRYTARNVHLYQADGQSQWSYRLSPLLPVIYVVLFFVRTGIETAILNESPFSFPTASMFLGVSTLALALLFSVDALWGFSTGLLVGRSAAVYHLWQQKLAAPPAPLASEKTA